MSTDLIERAKEHRRAARRVGANETANIVNELLDALKAEKKIRQEQGGVLESFLIGARSSGRLSASWDELLSEIQKSLTTEEPER